MTEIRPFLNSDPPHIVDLWHSQPPQRGLVPRINTTFLSQHVLGKPYFDREGMPMAFRDGRLVGFAHVGFGPNADGSQLSEETAVVSMLMTRNGSSDSSIAAELLDYCEAYCRKRDSKRLFAMGAPGLCPFYLGLYGGCQVPGVLREQAAARDAFAVAGYEIVDRTLIMHCPLSDGAIPIDRSQHLLRRNYDIEAAVNPSDRNWWEASTLGHFSRIQFDLIDQSGKRPTGEVRVWDMQPLASAWNITVAGLVDINLAEQQPVVLALCQPKQQPVCESVGQPVRESDAADAGAIRVAGDLAERLA
ncbi:MAG: hypothetical protein OSB47_12725, partial [Pirellulaceae bacterium]|nr:hypothetical protein [Pirellulaceae bacterium]